MGTGVRGSAMRVVWTVYGAAAYEALRGVVGGVKGGDPLAQVSVVVPTHLCGMIARRVLARGSRGGRAWRDCGC
jgi:hypothetical protein